MNCPVGKESACSCLITCFKELSSPFLHKHTQISLQSVPEKNLISVHTQAQSGIDVAQFHITVLGSWDYNLTQCELSRLEWIKFLSILLTWIDIFSVLQHCHIWLWTDVLSHLNNSYARVHLFNYMKSAWQNRDWLQEIDLTSHMQNLCIMTMM